MAEQVAEAEEKTAAAAAAKKAAQEEMKHSINEHIAAQRNKVLREKKLELEDAHKDHAEFATKLSALDNQEHRDREGARARANDTRKAQLAQMADKKRSAFRPPLFPAPATP